MSPRFKPVAILPTLCTLGNTFCGFLAIAKVADSLLNPEHFASNIVFAAWMIILAMIFDALDGRIARMTNQTSDFGAQLDSLTDLITFGVAPALLVKVVFDHSMSAAGVPYQQKFTLLLSVVYVMCATLRLARFTLDTEPNEESHERFYGLPSPAAAGLIVSIAFLLYEPGSPLSSISSETRVLITKGYLWLLPVLGILMVSRLEYVHIISRWFRGRRPFIHLVTILVFLLLLFTYHEVMVFAVFGGYALAGPLMAFAERSAGRKIFAPTEGDEGDSGASAGRPQIALVALGSNLGDRESHLAFAIDQLRRLPDTGVISVSDFVETEPVGGPAQRPYLNGAVKLETSLSPEELLKNLLEIERERGRERTVRNGPRVLDLDLILQGRVICESKSLTLPHPRFRERSFVLGPADQIAGDLLDPVTGKTIHELAVTQESGREP